MASTSEQRNQQWQANFTLPPAPTMTPEERVDRARKLQSKGRGTKNSTIRGRG